MAKHVSEDDRPSFAPLVIIAAVLLVAAGIGVWTLSRKSESTEQFVSEHIAAAEAGEDDDILQEEEGVMELNDSDLSKLAQLFNRGQVNSIRLIGDSITAGFGTDDYIDGNSVDENRVIFDNGSEVYRETPASVTCWANLFRRYAMQRGVRDFVNAGINGAFMNRLADYADAWLGDGADVVFVALGTNDAGYYGPQEFRETAQKALAAAAAKSKLVVVMAPVRDLRPESTLVEPAAELGDVLGELCEEQGYLFVDTRNAVTPEMFGDDGLHPTSEGSQAIWKYIQKTLDL